MDQPLPPEVLKKAELEHLAELMMDENKGRFRAANVDLSIGRANGLMTRGVFVEIADDWYHFPAARWSLFKWRWVVVESRIDLEATVREFLEAKVAGARP